MSEFFQRPGLVLVSRIDPAGWWQGNGQEHVAAGTKLGDDCTTNIYTPSEQGRVARYDRTTGAWEEEIDDVRAMQYFTVYGEQVIFDAPDAEVPEGLVSEVPPEYDPETQAVFYDGEAWEVYDDKVGRPFWRDEGVQDVVADKYFKLPEGATWDAPPDVARYEAAILESGAWAVVADYRGATMYRTDDAQFSEPVTEIGPIPDGWTVYAPPGAYYVFDEVAQVWTGDIDAAKAGKRAEVNKWRTTQENDETKTVEWNGANWNAGPSSQHRLDSAIVTGLDPAYWTDADNVNHSPITVANLVQIRAAINAYSFEIHERAQLMKSEIDTATDFATVEAYAVGW